MTFNHEAFRRGVEARLADAPGDRHSYTEMCWGLAEVMRAAGHEVQPMDLSSRWHDPLSGSDANDVADPTSPKNGWLSMVGRVIANAEAMVKKSLAETTSFEVRKLVERDTRYDGTFRIDMAERDVREALSEEEITRWATMYLDAAIKREQPKLRRNTKAYRQIFERNEDDYRARVRGEKIQAAERSIREVDWWLQNDSEHGGGLAHKRNSIERFVRIYRLVASDIEALGSDSPAIAELRRRADEVDGLWKSYEQGVLDRVERLRQSFTLAKSKVAA